MALTSDRERTPAAVPTEAELGERQQNGGGGTGVADGAPRGAAALVTPGAAAVALGPLGTGSSRGQVDPLYLNPQFRFIHRMVKQCCRICPNGGISPAPPDSTQLLAYLLCAFIYLFF